MNKMQGNLEDTAHNAEDNPVELAAYRAWHDKG